MNESILNGRLAWLGAALASRRHTITRLMNRLRGITQSGALALPHKFLRLIEQIAGDQEKERDLIYEIETVEKKHDELRRLNKLRHADALCIDTQEEMKEIIPPQPTEKAPERGSLLTLFGLIWLFSAKPIKHKNQDLTVD